MEQLVQLSALTQLKYHTQGPDTCMNRQGEKKGGIRVTSQIMQIVELVNHDKRAIQIFSQYSHHIQKK